MALLNRKNEGYIPSDLSIEIWEPSELRLYKLNELGDRVNEWTKNYGRSEPGPTNWTFEQLHANAAYQKLSKL